MNRTVFFYWITAIFIAALIQSCNQEKNTAPSSNTSSKGTLFIIGGGDRDDTLMQKMIDVSGWKKGDYITSITLASGYGDSAYIWINDQLQKLTGQQTVKFDSSAARDPKKLDSLLHSKIIFIGGGDQLHMMNRIEGTDVRKIIQQVYANGALVGGTSAGAAVMSEKMITGNQLLDTAYASTFPVIHGENLELKEGLGLLDSVIVDMHFVTRSRYNRLFSAIMEHPNYQCIGIDEATAIIVKGDSATVTGESEVMVFSHPKSVEQAPHRLLGARDIDVSVYVPGEKFYIKQ